MKKNQKITTCNWLDLEIVEFLPIIFNILRSNFPNVFFFDHYFSNSTGSSAMGNYPEVVNFNQLFLKLWLYNRVLFGNFKPI